MFVCVCDCVCVCVYLCACMRACVVYVKVWVYVYVFVCVTIFYGLTNVCYNASLLSIASGIDSMRTILIIICKIPYRGVWTFLICEA